MQAESSASASSSSNPTSIAEAALPTFARGVVALLQVWPALRLAVTHNWKPAQSATTNDPEYPPQNATEKRTRLAEELVDAYFSTYTSSSTLGKSPDPEEIEDFLRDFFEFEYGVKLEDASEIQIQKDSQELWKECIAKASGQSTSQAILEKFERMANKARDDDADPAKAFRGTRTGDQDEEDSDDYTTDDEDGGDEEGQAEGMAVDGQASQPRREEPQVDEDGFTTVVKGKKGGH